jgi:hypothetical protein
MSAAARIIPERMSPAASGWRAIDSSAVQPMRLIPKAAAKTAAAAAMAAPILANDATFTASSIIVINIIFNIYKVSNYLSWNRKEFSPFGSK